MEFETAIWVLISGLNLFGLFMLYADPEPNEEGK